MSCKTVNEPIKIKFSESNEEVTLFYSKKMNAIWAISLPFNVEITNPSSEEKAFRNYTYNYGNQLKGKAMKMYLINNETLLKQSVSNVKFINVKSSERYLITSKHFVDTTKFNRHFFKPYIEEMRKLKQDTLNIGTVSDFSKKHSKLFKWLTYNDSIMIQPMKPKSGFEKEIRIPVEY